jgi:hypothetical protein
MTGVLSPPVRGGAMVIPGSTLGGAIVPCCRDNVLLMDPEFRLVPVALPVALPLGGAIFSGGVVGECGGAMGTVGLAGGADGDVCAKAGTANIVIATREMKRLMVKNPCCGRRIRRGVVVAASNT